MRARDYQDRPQLASVCEWWRAGGAGVCALVGIGGAGKTALADRFLQLLPDVLPDQPALQKRDDLVTPSGVFVYSFYSEPSPETFFERLYGWLMPREDPANVLSYQRLLDVLADQEDLLLILDGLERAQEDSSRGGAFGRIADGRLRDLVVRCADGWLQGVSLLATTRFHLLDALVMRCSYYRQVDVHRMTPESAVSLLRARGVSKGSDDDLRRVAEAEGFHALSLDLTGGYIATFLGGDPGGFPGGKDRALATEDSDQVLDLYGAAVRDQERRFSRVAERYYEALSKSDMAALILLQRVCLFRMGVDAKTLFTIFAGRSDLVGAPLADLSLAQVKSKLDLLSSMHLVEQSSRVSDGSADDSEEYYHVHPAVRDGFLATMGPDTVKYHEAVSRGLATPLKGQPSTAVPTQDAVNLMEEIVHHTICAGHVSEAWDIYNNRIGGSKTLFWRLGAFEQGERMCRAFVDAPPDRAVLPAPLPEADQAAFANEWGLYLAAVGQLEAATVCYQRSIDIRLRAKSHKNASIGYQNLAKALIRAGLLPRAAEAAGAALECAERDGSPVERYRSLSIRAHVRYLMGSVTDANQDIQDALVIQQAIFNRPEGYLLSYSGLWQSELLLRLGQIDAAKAAVDGNLAVLEQSSTSDHVVAGCELIRALIAHRKGCFAEAKDHLARAREWAIKHRAPDVQCWSHLVAAQVEFTVRSRMQEIDAGLRLCRNYNFGLYRIDLLALRAETLLHLGRAEEAAGVAQEALVHGDPSDEEGSLYGAAHAACRYAWGAIACHRTLSQASLWQVADRLKSVQYEPGRVPELNVDAQALLTTGRDHLRHALLLAADVGGATAGDLQASLDALDQGVLLQGWHATPVPGTRRTEDELPDVQVLLIGPGIEWVQPAGGRRASLLSRHAARSILKKLLETREHALDLALSREELVRVGWPGENLDPQVAKRRFHTALWTLRRRFQLEDAIVSRHDGYLLHPRLDVRFAKDDDETV